MRRAEIFQPQHFPFYVMRRRISAMIKPASCSRLAAPAGIVTATSTRSAPCAGVHLASAKPLAIISARRCPCAGASPGTSSVMRPISTSVIDLTFIQIRTQNDTVLGHLAPRRRNDVAHAYAGSLGTCQERRTESGRLDVGAGHGQLVGKQGPIDVADQRLAGGRLGQQRAPP